MHGKTCKILIPDILKLYPFNTLENENVILKYGDIQNGLEDPSIDAIDKICIHMLFSAIVELIGSDIFMPSTRYLLLLLQSTLL